MPKQKFRIVLAPREVGCTEFSTFYDDSVAYLKDGIKKGWKPEDILSTLIHDIAGMVRQERCFVPRVSGWAKKGAI